MNTASEAPLKDIAIAHTRNGDLRGRRVGGVFSFAGVRYGEDTAATRFRQAQPVLPWSGVRDAFDFGNQCLQPGTPDFELLRSGWDEPAASSEDCLFLNLWSPGIDHRRRPVMFNLHGGGWTVGNGNSAGRSGETFAGHHDIVRVNVNHRLGIFGFSALADLLGPDYADSGNVGILDVVLALRWVRENIAEFGGDPDNVTIFGVSGGGGKVSTLMAMPAAKGLFHKASVESGPMLTAQLPSAASEASARLLSALDIPPQASERLLSLSGEELLAGYLKLYPDGGLGSAVTGPVVDGVNLPSHPFDPVAPDVSSDVPLLIGTTTTETSIFLTAAFDTTWETLAGGLANFLPPTFPLSAQALVNRAREIFPDASPARIFFMLTTELTIRSRSIRQAELAAQRGAPVYMWLLTWETPVDGGKWGSPHGLTVPLIMDTVASVPSMFGEDLSGPLALSATMSSAWAAFARTGSPDVPGLPTWTPYEPDERWTMIFDKECTLVSDPLSELRILFESAVAITSARDGRPLLTASVGATRLGGSRPA